MVYKINTYKLSLKPSENILGIWLPNFNFWVSYQPEEEIESLAGNLKGAFDNTLSRIIVSVYLYNTYGINP